MGGFIVKFYKIILITILALLIITGSVSANSIVDLSIVEGEVCATLSGTVNMLDLGFYEKQLKNRSPYYPLQLAVAISNPKTMETLYANQVQTNEDGTYSLKFIMNSEEAVYKLVIYTAYGKIYDGEIDYKDGTVSKINQISEIEDVTMLSDYLRDYNRYINIDLSLYNQFEEEEKASVLGTIMDNAPYITKADVRSAFSDGVFNVGLVTESLGDEDKNKMFNEYIESLSDEYDKIGAFITEKELGAGIIELFKKGNYTSVKDDIYALSLKSFLTHSVENVLDIESLFDDNLFSVPEDIFEEYAKSEQKTQIYTSLYKKIDEIITLDDFYDAVKNSIPEPIQQVVTTGRGGSGSGGKKSGYSGPSVIVTNTVNDNENTTVNVNTDKNVNTSQDIAEIFSDLDLCQWAHEAINELYKIGAVNGNNGVFLPSNNIKREEFAKIVAKAFDINDNTEETSKFSDVNENDWFSSSVGSLVSKNIVNGISENEFGVGKPITRQDAATILFRILNATSDTAEQEKFADDEDIAEYAKESIYTLKNSKMISGYSDGTFRPNSHITRAEAVQMIYNILKLGKEGANVEN